MTDYIYWASGEYLTHFLCTPMIERGDHSEMLEFVSEHLSEEWQDSDPSDVLASILRLGAALSRSFDFKE